MKEVLCNIDATRSWFAEGKSAPLASWISDEEFQTHKKIFNPSNGGLGPPLKWYKAQVANLNTQDESTILPENLNVQQRSLLITCSKDYIAVPAMQEEVMRPYVKNLKVETVETGHWLQLEKPGEVNAILQSFFEEVDEV